MIEQDYLMRQIHEMISVIMKMLFHRELQPPHAVISLELMDSSAFFSLIRLVRSGDILLAESLLYEGMDALTAENLLRGYAFYQFLAQQDDDFLIQYGYSRRQIADGAARLAALFHAEHLAKLFLPD